MDFEYVILNLSSLFLLTKVNFFVKEDFCFNGIYPL